MTNAEGPDGNKPGEKPKGWLKRQFVRFKKPLKIMGSIYLVLLVIATVFSFPAIRAFLYPLFSMSSDGYCSVSDYCPVYTTDEKPAFLVTADRVLNYELKIVRADDLFKFLPQDRATAARFSNSELVELNSLYESNAHFANVPAAAKVSGAVQAQDLNRASMIVTVPALKPGDYIGILGQPGQSQPCAQTTFLRFRVTDLGAVAKHDSEKILVSTVDLRTRKPWADATIQVVRDGSFASLNVPVKTNAGGIAVINRPANISKQDWDTAIVDITSGGHSAFFGLPPGFSYFRPGDGTENGGNWERYVGTRYRTFIDTDRPLYRLGQTINFRGYVRRVTAKGIANISPGTAIDISITDPEGNEIRTMQVHPDASGSFSGQIRASENTKTGQYQLNISYPDETADSVGILVDQYRKPDFKVDVIPMKARFERGEKARFKVQANYYFGAPLKDAKINYTVSASTDMDSKARLKQSSTADGDFFKGWGTNARYGVYENDIPFNTEGTLMTDGEGQAFIEFDIPKAESSKIADPYSYNFLDSTFNVKVETTDLSRKTFSAEGSVPVAQGDFAVMIDDRDSSVVKAGEPIAVRVKAVDYDRKPVSSKKVVFKLTRWKWEAKLFGEGKFTSEVIASSEATTDANGAASVSFPTKADFTSDSYYVTAETADDEKRTIGDVTSVWLMGARNAYYFENRSDEERFSVELDKDVYKPGEVLKAIVKAPLKEGEEAYVLATVEGASLREYKQIRMTGPVAVVEFPVDPTYMPNAYITASFVLPNHKPFSASTMLKVSPANNFVNVSVTTDKPRYRPGETVKYSVTAKDKSGAPVPNMLFSASVVDEGIFAVFDGLRSQMYLNSHGDICSSLYRAIENEVTTRFSFTEAHVGELEDRAVFDGSGLMVLHSPMLLFFPVVSQIACQESDMAMSNKKASRMLAEAAPASAPVAGGMPAEESRQAGGGGNGFGGAACPPAPRVRSNFVDTAAWYPSVITGPAGTATFSIKLPDDLTTWRATVNGVSTGAMVGTQTASVLSTQDFMARLALPRFYTQYDETTISGLIHNLSAVDQAVKVSLDVSPNIKLLESNNVSLNLAKDSVKRQSWKVKILSPGEAKVTLKAMGTSFADAEERKLPVRNFGYRVYFAKNGVIKDNAAEKVFPLKFPPEADLASGSFLVSASASTIGPVLGNFEKLIDYPYGCTEQTLSKMIPSVVAKRLSTNLHIPLDKEMESIFKDANALALSKLSEYQHDDGGWGWWKDDKSDAYMTAHVLEGFYLLNKAGVEVDLNRIERGRDFLNSQIQSLSVSPWNTFSSEDQAKGVYVSSLYGGQLDPITRTWQLVNLKKMTPEALAYLTMAFKNAKDDRAAQQTYERLKELRSDSLDYSNWDHTSEMLKKMGHATEWDYTYRFTGVETTALALRATVIMEPQNEELLGRITRWLAVERDENGWNNTKCTTAVFLALLEKELASNPDRQTNFTARVETLNKLVKELKFQKTFERGEQTASAPLQAGADSVKLKKNGPGWLYYSTLLSYNRPLKPGEQPILKSLPSDLKIKREFFKLVAAPRKPNEETEYKVVPLGTEPVKAGDVIKMRVLVDCPIRVPYAMVEAFLPSGGEVLSTPPRLVAEKSESVPESEFVDHWYWWTHQDVLDDRITFFSTEMPSGKAEFEAYIRMEMPGKFNINPVNMEAMYTNKIRGRSAAHDITVVP